MGRRTLQLYPDHVPANICSVVSLVRLERMEDARLAAGRLLELNPDFRIGQLDERYAFWRSLKNFVPELRAAGIPE